MGYRAGSTPVQCILPLKPGGAACHPSCTGEARQEDPRLKGYLNKFMWLCLFQNKKQKEELEVWQLPSLFKALGSRSRIKKKKKNGSSLTIFLTDVWSILLQLFLKLIFFKFKICKAQTSKLFYTLKHTNKRTHQNKKTKTNPKNTQWQNPVKCNYFF